MAQIRPCLESKGFKLTAVSNSECQITVAEQYPLFNEARTWDGKLSGTYIVGKSITLPFSGLAPDHFAGRLVIFFEFEDQQWPKRKVITTASGENWIELPRQPTKRDVTGIFLTESQKQEAYNKLIMGWDQEIKALGRDNGPTSVVDDFGTTVDPNTGRTNVRIAIGQTPELIQTLKNLIAKCKS